MCEFNASQQYLIQNIGYFVLSEIELSRFNYILKNNGTFVDTWSDDIIGLSYRNRPTHNFWGITKYYNHAPPTVCIFYSKQNRCALFMFKTLFQYLDD